MPTLAAAPDREGYALSPRATASVRIAIRNIDLNALPASAFGDWDAPSD